MLGIAIAIVQFVFTIAVIGLTLWAIYAVLWHFVFQYVDVFGDKESRVHRGQSLRQLGFPRHQFPIGLTEFAPGNKTKANTTLRAIEKIATGAFNQSKGGE
jgi:hypothetical protein